MATILVGLGTKNPCAGEDHGNLEGEPVSWELKALETVVIVSVAVMSGLRVDSCSDEFAARQSPDSKDGNM
jgi:hypothetical protein